VGRVVPDVDVVAEKLRTYTITEKDRWSSTERPPKFPEHEATMSSTAAGSRMTLYFPGAKLKGSFDSAAYARRFGNLWIKAGDIGRVGAFASQVSRQNFAAFACAIGEARELKMPSKISALE